MSKIDFKGTEYDVTGDPTTPIYELLRSLADQLEKHNIKYIDDISIDNCEGITVLEARTEEYEMGTASE